MNIWKVTPTAGEDGSQEWVTGFRSFRDVLGITFLILSFSITAACLIGIIAHSPNRGAILGVLIVGSINTLWLSFGLFAPARRLIVSTDGSMTFKRRNRTLQIARGELMVIRSRRGPLLGPHLAVTATAGKIAYVFPIRQRSELLAQIANAHPEARIMVPADRHFCELTRGKSQPSTADTS